MNRRGFTLIEVLVALVVVATAMVALVKTGGYFTRQTGTMIDRSQARMVVQNLIADAYLEESLSTGTREGRETQGLHEWHWQVKVEIVEAEPPAPAAQHAHFKVFRNAGDEYPVYQQSIVFSSLKGATQ